LDEQEKIIEQLQEIFATRNCDDWVEFFKKYDTCVTAVKELKDAFIDPQVLHRKMVQKLTYSGKDGEKTIFQLGVPIKMSDTPGTIRTRPPKYGEHTAEILRDLGYSADEIGVFLQRGTC